MTRHRIHATLLTVALLLIAGCSQDEPKPEDTLEDPIEVAAPGDAIGGAGGDRAALEAEYVGIQRRLGPLQNKAMEDPALQAEFQAFEASVEEAMIGLDPESPANQERLVALQTEFQAAQAAGDSAKSQTILQEGNALSAQVQQTRTEAFEQEAVVAKMTAFQEHVVAKMVEIDPEAQAMIDRATALATQLQAPAP